jgi:hypothetical protein
MFSIRRRLANPTSAALTLRPSHQSPFTTAICQVKTTQPTPEKMRAASKRSRDPFHTLTTYDDAPPNIKSAQERQNRTHKTPPLPPPCIHQTTSIHTFSVISAASCSNSFFEQEGAEGAEKKPGVFDRNLAPSQESREIAKAEGEPPSSPRTPRKAETIMIPISLVLCQTNLYGFGASQSMT